MPEALVIYELFEGAQIRCPKTGQVFTISKTSPVPSDVQMNRYLVAYVLRKSEEHSKTCTKAQCKICSNYHLNRAARLRTLQARVLQKYPIQKRAPVKTSASSAVTKSFIDETDVKKNVKVISTDGAFIIEDID